MSEALNCPACGGPIERRNPGILTLVCAHCENVVYWDEEGVRAAGFKSALTEGFTRLFRDAVGQIADKRVRVLGRVRYRHPRGFWDEWYVAYDDDTLGWITEDDHELAIEEPGRREDFHRARVGDRFDHQGTTWHVEEVGEAECIGVEGELPDVYALGELYRFADASSVDGRSTLAIEYDEEPPVVFRGRWVPVGAIRLECDKRGGGNEAIRARPEHVARTVQCPNCAAPLRVADEATQLRTCDSCDSRLQLSETDARVVGRKAPGAPDFALPLGQRFRWKGHDYEVAARLRWAESDDSSDTGDHYLLYHPVAGSLWLDSYERAWTLTWSAHAAPPADVAGLRVGSTIRTGDGQSWTKDDHGVLVLAYVDGALPWVAEVGDRVAYVEFSGGGNGVYEVVSDRDEVSFGAGETISPAQLREATGRTDVSAQAAGIKAHTRKSVAMYLVKVAFAAGVVHVLAIVGLALNEREVLREKFSASDLESEVLSSPFEAQRGEVIEVGVSAPTLNNAWMAMDVGLVNAQERVVHVTDAEASYYHGVDQGERWSEGSSRGVVWLRAPETGSWRILLHAVSGALESTSSSTNEHDATLEVEIGGRPGAGLFGGLICCAIGVLVGGWGVTKLAEDDD